MIAILKKYDVEKLDEVKEKCDITIQKQVNDVIFSFFLDNSYDVFNQYIGDIPPIVNTDIQNLLKKGKEHTVANYTFKEPNRGTLKLPNGYNISIIQGGRSYNSRPDEYEIALFDPYNKWLKPSVMINVYKKNKNINIGNYTQYEDNYKEADKTFVNEIIGYITFEELIELALEIAKL